MATYVIGDLQGCFEPLQRLLAALNYQPPQDSLWFCGDLIARGPDSLACLRFVKQLGSGARVVLGNHDLNFIAHY
ncbi:MAG: metallophosphoesterase [Alishewanella aestuarii]